MKARTCLGSLIAAATLLGCDGGATTAPFTRDTFDPQLSRAPGVLSDDHCVNFAAQAVGGLGVYEDPANPGNYLFGAMPTPMTIAGLDGTLYSFVDFEYISGSRAQGAHHIVLHHHFDANDAAGSWFQTDDLATCAPRAGEGCRVNDQMRVVDGSGVFDHAEGIVRNHGIVNIPAGWLDLNLSGRVCGDGVG